MQMLDKIKGVVSSLNITWVTLGKWATITLVVLGSFGGYTYFVYNSGKDSMLPKIAQAEKNLTEVVHGIEKNNLQVDKTFGVLSEVYQAELHNMETNYEKDIKRLNDDLANYQRQRVRDKNDLRAAQDRISSLSEAAQHFTRTNTGGGELFTGLERLETGVLTRLVFPAERENAKLRVCQQYIGVAKRLKEKYDALRAEHPIEVIPVEGTK